MNPELCRAAVYDMFDIVSCAEKLGASAPGTGSRAAIGEDLPAKTRALLQARANSQESNSVAKRRRRVESIPLTMISADGTVTNTLHRPYHNPVEYSMVSHINSPRIPVRSLTSDLLHSLGFFLWFQCQCYCRLIWSSFAQIPTSLEEEIRDINRRLIDTTVEVSPEATEEVAARGQSGIVLSCCYKGNATSPNLLFLQEKEYSLVRL